jgi:hypothetical protein
LLGARYEKYDPSQSLLSPPDPVHLLYGTYEVRLYKYRPINEYLKNIFLKNTIWFPKRNTLNDPEDILLTVTNDVDTEVYKMFLKMKAKKENWSQYFLRNSYKHAFTGKSLSKDAILKIDGALRSVQRYFDMIGVLSLSEDENSAILWERYADNHKGVCIGFELNENELLLQVTYHEVRPRLSLSDLLIKENAINIMIDVLRTKTKTWTDEKEWRYFIENGDVEHNYLGTIKTVRFGNYCRDHDVNLVKQIINNSGQEIEVIFGSQIR